MKSILDIFVNAKKLTLALFFLISGISAYANNEAIGIQNEIIKNEHEVAVQTNKKKALDEELMILEEKKRFYISEIGKKEKLINDLESRSAEMQSTVDTLMRQLDVAAREMSALEEQQRELNDKERRCRNEVIWIISCFFTNEINKISDERNNLRRRQGRFEMEIHEKLSIINENREEKNMHAQKINESRYEIDLLTKKIDETLEKWKSIDREIDALNDYIFKLRSSLLALN